MMNPEYQSYEKYSIALIGGFFFDLTNLPRLKIKTWKVYFLKNVKF